MKWPNFMQNFPVLCGIYWFTGQLRCGPKTGCSVTECKNHWTVSWAISQRPRCIGQNINAKYCIIHLYFTISVANNYKHIHCNTKKQKHRQNEQASNVQSLQGQPRKFEQKIIARIIFYEITPVLRRSRSFKVTDVGTNRKPICDFLLVINNNRHSNPYRFEVIADHGRNYHFTFFSRPLGGGA